jgi:hypothetical protein
LRPKNITAHSEFLNLILSRDLSYLSEVKVWKVWKKPSRFGIGMGCNLRIPNFKIPSMLFLSGSQITKK